MSGEYNMNIDRIECSMVLNNTCENELIICTNH